MTFNRILLTLLILGVLCSCTQTPEQITEKVRKATVLVDGNSGDGSGFFIAPDMIVTNIHVVAGNQDVSVFGNSKGTVEYNVVYNIEKVIGSDPAHDLVILQVSGKPKGAPLSLSNCQIGEPIFVAGHPKGGKYKISGGIVRSNSDTNIRFDAKIYPGNSGGPVLNLKGEVVGIAVGVNAALFNAIPSNILKALLQRSKSEQGQSWDEWQQGDSIRAYVHFKSGIKNGEDNKYDKAIEDYTKAVELYRNFTDAYKNRGRARHRLGKSNMKNENIKKARSLYEEAIEDVNKSPDGAYDYYSLGKVKYDLGNLEANSTDGTEKALKHYQDAVSDYSTAIDKQNRDYPVAYLNRALAKIRLSELKTDKEKAITLYNEAINDLTEAIRTDLNDELNTDAYLNRALAKIRLGELKTDKEKAITLYNEAINDLTEAIRTELNDELNARPYLHRAEVYFRLGKLKSNQGNTAKAQSLYSDGLDDFAKAVKLDQDVANEMFEVSKVSAQSPVKLDQDVANDFELNPQSTAYGYYIQGGLELILGQSKASQGDVEKVQNHYRNAFHSYDKAKKLNPDDADVYYDKAIKILNPDDADTYQIRGAFKSLLGEFKAKQGEVQEARQHYQEAIEDYQEAVKRYENATKQNSEYIVFAYRNLASTKRLLGKSFESDPDQENMKYARSLYKKAEADDEKAKELNPNIGK